MKAIIIHGGVRVYGKLKENPERIDELKKAVKMGYETLLEGGSALDAVEASVRYMEDSPLFNAGYGSSLNILGEVELDASIMDGKSLRAGAVGGVKGVRHAITLARAIMEETPHILLVGEGARKFASIIGMEVNEDLVYEARKELYKAYMKGVGKKGFPSYLPSPELIRNYLADTVGAVAVDDKGRLAAATSTGGIMMKLPGRVGDSAIIGAGTYANEAGACSGTGVGEAAMKVLGAKQVVDLISEGIRPQKAVEEVLRRLWEKTKTPFGFIAIDREGNIGYAHSGVGLWYAFSKGGVIEAGVERRRVKVEE
ncbi:MAG: asparaginase [Thermoproteota archaeon]|nr:MAG: asparaginase [Candidatus Korarchaeota archaeon]